MKIQSMPKITAENLINILEGYRKCDPDRLTAIAGYIGVPEEYLMNEYIREATEEDINDVQEAINSTKEEHTEAISDTIITYLRTAAIDDSHLTPLPDNIYKQLAKLTSDYSYHHHTKTVYFRNNALEIKPEDGYPDSSKDTYVDNGPVAENYIKLITAIIDIARNEEKESVIFPTLAKLFQHITTLSANACNQENAVDFARVLEEYAPASHSAELNSTTEEDSNKEKATESNNQAHNHSNDINEDSTKKEQDGNDELKEIDLIIFTSIPYYEEELLSSERKEYNKSIEAIKERLEETYVHILYDENTNPDEKIETDMHYIKKHEFDPFILTLELTLPLNIFSEYSY